MLSEAKQLGALMPGPFASLKVTACRRGMANWVELQGAGMREPPADLTEQTMLVTLRKHFGLEAGQLSFLPLGHDSSAWVYRLDAADGRPFFVKVRLAVTNPASLLMPRLLRDHGVEHVVAPLPARDGALWAPAAGYALIVYPFIAGGTGMELGMTPEQWRAYGRTLRQIHAVPVPPELAGALRRETFVPDGALKLVRLDTYLDAPSPDDPAVAELAGFWRANRATIHALLDRAEQLGRRLAQDPPPAVLCHADIHTNNLLVGAEGEVWFVDWDEALLAPKERDLMFAVGGISEEYVKPENEAAFLEGYGAAAIDPVALMYYRYAWAVGDIGAFGEEICFRPDLGPATRAEALRLLRGLFAPGQIVAIALGSG